MERSDSSCCSYVNSFRCLLPVVNNWCSCHRRRLRLFCSWSFLISRSFQAGFDCRPVEGLEDEGDPSHSGWDGYIKGGLLESSGGDMC